MTCAVVKVNVHVSRRKFVALSRVKCCYSWNSQKIKTTVWLSCKSIFTPSVFFGIVPFGKIFQMELE